MMNTTHESLPEITIEDFRSRYPVLFSDPAVDDIYCNRGWREILLALCDTLQEHSNRHPGVVPVTVGQIKSKFGELHFFFDGGDDYCHGAVSVAAQLSLRTCEQCGAPGKPVAGRWVNTLCSAHDGSDSSHTEV